jgi:hypothetical protein
MVEVEEENAIADEQDTRVNVETSKPITVNVTTSPLVSVADSPKEVP